MARPEWPAVTGGLVGAVPVGTVAPLHGGAGGGGPHVLVLTVAVVGLLVLVAGLVVGVDRLLAAVGG